MDNIICFPLPNIIRPCLCWLRSSSVIMSRWNESVKSHSVLQHSGVFGPKSRFGVSTGQMTDILGVKEFSMNGERELA